MTGKEFRERMAYRHKVDNLYDILRRKYDHVDDKERQAISILMTALKVYQAYLKYLMRDYEVSADCSCFVRSVLDAAQDAENKKPQRTDQKKTQEEKDNGSEKQTHKP